MTKTVTFVTNQYRCDRIINTARLAADKTNSELLVVGILDSKYALDAQVIDYLFRLSKKNNATMRLLFTEERIQAMIEAVSQYDCKYVVTGMPSNSDSVLYTLWKKFPDKQFFTVDDFGELIEVATTEMITAV